MGLGICCKNSPREEEEHSNEMKNGILPSLEKKGEDFEKENNSDPRILSFNLNPKYNKLESMDTDFMNSDQQNSEEIFEIFNNIRSNPNNYLNEAQKYNLYNLISSAVERAENITALIKNPFFDLFFDKCVKASPKSKEDILKNIEKENLFKDYDKVLYIMEGNKEKMDECVWNLIKSCADNGEDILAKDIDYLVITTMSLDDKNKFLSYFLFLSKIKANSGNESI